MKLQAWFKPEFKSPLWIARAPGRYDLMGGIADYCGSLVLECPLGLDAQVAVQETPHPQFRFFPAQSGGPYEAAVFDSGQWYHQDKLIPAEALSQALAGTSRRHWASYVAGVLHQCLEGGWLPRPRGGLDFWVASRVPTGAGVSSSAALEVAALRALQACFGFEKSGVEMALLAQAAENKVAGAPCGVMDQATSLLGRRGKLLKLECKPCRPLGYVGLPDGVDIFGINTGVKHQVGGSRYGQVRRASERARGLLEEKAGVAIPYLAALPLEGYEGRLRELLPEGDLRRAADHHVPEGNRVPRFAALLEKGNEASLREAGSLMLESHRSYGENCGLGCGEADWLVERLMETQGVYGAKISGGGAGGTVVILARREAAPALAGIHRDYEIHWNLKGDFFEGSSPGALESPAQRLETP